MNDINRRVREVVGGTFGLDPSALNADSGHDTIDGWDSMNHIHLIVALEGEFQISFDPDEAIELTTVGAIERAIARMKPS